MRAARLTVTVGAATAAALAVATVPALRVDPAAVAAAARPAAANAAPPGARAAPRAASDCPAVPGAAAAPTPEQVLGRSLTASRTSPEEADRYLLALDAASSRIRTAVAGRSGQGRPLRYAIVGDPRHLRPAALRRIATAAQAVRAGASGPRGVARASRGPALVWLGGGVHANEPSGTAALLEALARLASGDDCATRRTLRGTVAIVQPDQNPDGHAAGTRTNAAGFDLNRDWFAASQPETVARIALLRRYPPTIAIDEHEQTGRDYFTPPYAAPVLRGLPTASRRIADQVVVPAVSGALRAQGATVTHGAGYDLLYPGYGDSATSLLFGAGGMTFEQGSDPPLAEKVGHHRTAALAALAAVARDPAAVVRAWAEGFAIARAEGRRGRTVADGSVRGWVLRTERHAGDARALAATLAASGVEVRALRRTTTVRRYDPLGPTGAGRVRLPAGTIVVPAEQPLRRWAEALLGRDADEAGRDVSGEDSWSMPRLAGVDAGVLRDRLPTGALGRLRATPRSSAADGAGVGFAADSAAADRLALELLARGRPLRRAADGFRTLADGALRQAARRAGVAVTAADGGQGAVLARPSVVVLADPTPPLTGAPAALPLGERPSGWLTAGLARLGAPARTVSAAAIEADGVPAGTTHLVVGPAAPGPDGIGPALRARLDRFVSDGGTLVVLGADGIDAATRAGLSAIHPLAAPRRDAVAVAASAGGDPIGRAIGGDGWAIVAGEPRLSAPPGAVVALRAGSGAALAPSGPVAAADGLSGRPLVVDERRGAGHVVTLGFSPLFRGQSAGGERVLAAVLLAAR